MAANNWTGNAQATTDIWTISIGGTWVAADTITVTALGKSFTLTIGSLVTVAQVCQSLVEAYNSMALTDTASSVSPTYGGRGIPEFSELVASVGAAGATVVLTCQSPGKSTPTITVGKSSTSGTASITHTTTATGPNYWNNAANWSAGTVPVSTDDVTIDRPVSILYGLAQSTVTLASMTITSRFDSTAQIGNPSRNPLGYEEWRDTELAISATVVSITTGSGMIKVNFGTVATTATVYSTGRTTESGRCACQLRGTNVSNVLQVFSTSVNQGEQGADVGWGANGETATLATLLQNSGTATVGKSVTLTTVTKNGGLTRVYCGGTTMSHSAGISYLYSGAWTTVTISGDILYDLSTSTVTTLTLNNAAVYDASGNPGAKTITNCTMNGSSAIIDTSGRLTFTNAIARKGRITVAAA